MRWLWRRDELVTMIVDDIGIVRVLSHLGQPTNFPLTKPPRAAVPFGVEAREDGQLDPRTDDDRQDWPGSPGADLPA